MSREDLIAAIRATAQKPKVTKHEVEGWGTVYTRALSLAQLELQQASIPKPGLDFARNAARVLCDENGDLLFDPENEEDLKVLAVQDWTRLSGVIGGAAKDDATTDAGVEDAKNA